MNNKKIFFQVHLLQLTLVILFFLQLEVLADEKIPSSDFSYQQKTGEVADSPPTNNLRKANPLSNLKHFLSEELILGDQCPNEIFEKQIDYIRYLFRLLSLSYIHESLLDYQSVATDLGISANECQIDWQKFIKLCHPQNQDMRSFQARATSYLKEIKKKETSNHQISISEIPNSISKTRISFEPIKISFANLSLLEKKELFNKICKEEKNLFQQICSEKDRVYGLSDSPQASHLLLNSHTLRNIDHEGKGEGCLNRFVHFYKHQENYPNYMNSLILKVSEELSKRKELHYLQGKLYLSGSLREFDEKNLKNFLYSEIGAPTTKDLAPKKVAPPLSKAPAQKVTVLPKEETKAVPILVETIPKNPVISKQSVLSAFESAYKFFNESEKKSAIEVDMHQFLEESPFSPSLVAKILPTIIEYSSQEALKEMKQFDKLGSLSMPLSLLFLKILILNKDHHRIFNIKRILGPIVYIINDIEDKLIPVPINFHFDEKEKRWKIFIVPIPSQLNTENQ